MTVSELIDYLKEFSPDTLIVMSKDGEGNSFGPLDDIGGCYYAPESTWYGEVVHEDDLDMYNEDELLEAVCLWPVN